MTNGDQLRAAMSVAVDEFRRTVPLVQCLTNIVAAQWTANVLLAAGAAPAMVDNPEEAGGFAEVASGTLVNLGTPYPETVAAMRAAVEARRRSGAGWVLDPVAVGGLPWRTEIARELVRAHPPAVIRGNSSEIAGLAGAAGGRGVDATDRPEDVLPAARQLADEFDCVVAVSGEVDHIVAGDELVRVHNGDVMMTRVTGVGCALGALMSGLVSVAEPRVAAITATAWLTVAADRAMATAAGPGSFAAILLDEVAAVDGATIAAAARLS
ncbi:hydroxyethylthiazole kinase [Propionibacteriaceae bacterium Y2011]